MIYLVSEVSCSFLNLFTLLGHPMQCQNRLKIGCEFTGYACFDQIFENVFQVIKII